MNFVSRPRGYCNHGMYGGDCMACSHMGEITWAETANTSLSTIKWVAILGFSVWAYYSFVRPTIKSVKSASEKSYKAFKAAQRELENSK